MAVEEGAPGLWRSVRSMPPAAWVLFAGSFVNRFGSFVLVFLVIWLTEEGYSPARAGGTSPDRGPTLGTDFVAATTFPEKGPTPKDAPTYDNRRPEDTR